jgi:hypothetical protein
MPISKVEVFYDYHVRHVGLNGDTIRCGLHLGEDPRMIRQSQTTNEEQYHEVT